MLKRDDFSSYFQLNSPANPEQIQKAAADLGFVLPPSYTALVALTDGLSCDGNLVLLEIEGVAARNADYEVAEYLPGYVMIGDDSGGVAIVMKTTGDAAVYEVDMGVMDQSALKKSASSLEQLLIAHNGRTLGERN